MDDRALLAQVAAGDRRAFEVMYRRHAPWVTRRLQSRCGDPDLADIALQDTFLAIWRSAKSFRNDGDVGAWIWGIAIRRLVDVLRKRRATPIDPSSIVVESGDLDDAVDQVALGGLDGDLEQAMRDLPGELQAVLVATAVDGLSTKEAARLLGVPQGTVKTRLMRARQRMQEALT